LDRPGPVRQCRRALAGERRAANPADRIYLRPPRRRNLRARRRAASPRRHGRRRPQRRPPRRRRAAGRSGGENGGNLVSVIPGRCDSIELWYATAYLRISLRAPRNDSGITRFSPLSRPSTPLIRQLETEETA